MITEAVRDDFPILKREMMGHPLIYLDSGATALKPQCVIDAVSEYYAVLGANAHRGDYALSAEVDRRFEEARAAVAAFCMRPTAGRSCSPPAAALRSIRSPQAMCAPG